VSGQVTLDGKPLPIGNIIFVPANGPAVSAPIKDGAYTAPGVPTGEIKVAVETDSIKKQIDQTKKGSGPGKSDPSVSGPPAGSSAAQNMPPAAKEFFEKQRAAAAEAAKIAKELAAEYRPLPDRYKDASSSGLSLTVSGGSNKFDAALTSK